jgi:hypothetical protein
LSRLTVTFLCLRCLSMSLFPSLCLISPSLFVLALPVSLFPSLCLLVAHLSLSISVPQIRLLSQFLLSLPKRSVSYYLLI